MIGSAKIICRRRGLPAALAGIAALAGCAAGPTTSGTFVVARTGDVDTLDPHRATAFQTRQALELVYDTLVEVDAAGRIRPGLATRWSYGGGGRALRLTLRSGVRFHDGSRFSSADAKASLARVLDEKTGAVARSNIAGVRSIDAPDRDTLVLHMSRPDAAVLYALGDVNLAILPRAATATGVGRDPVGTGPFRFVSRQPGESVVLRANPGYWGGAPRLRRVEIRVIPDETSVLASLRAHTVQLGILTDPSVIRQVRVGSLKVQRTKALAYHTLMLNARHGALRQEAVRQAIACAIDRRQVAQTAAFGQGAPTGPITSPAFRSDPVAGLPCRPPDPRAARALLARAGIGRLTLRTIVMTGGYVTAVNEAQSLQAQLRKIGVRLELERLDTNAYVKRWLVADYDAAVALNSGSYDPSLMYDRFFARDGNLAKPAGYGSARIDALLRRGVAETDPAQRRAIFSTLSRELLRSSPWAWVFSGYEYRVMQKGVRGFQLKPDGSMKSLRDTVVDAGV